MSLRFSPPTVEVLHRTDAQVPVVPSEVGPTLTARVRSVPLSISYGTHVSSPSPGRSVKVSPKVYRNPILLVFSKSLVFLQPRLVSIDY